MYPGRLHRQRLLWLPGYSAFHVRTRAAGRLWCKQLLLPQLLLFLGWLRSAWLGALLVFLASLTVSWLQ